MPIAKDTRRSSAPLRTTALMDTRGIDRGVSVCLTWACAVAVHIVSGGRAAAALHSSRAAAPTTPPTPGHLHQPSLGRAGGSAYGWDECSGREKHPAKEQLLNRKVAQMRRNRTPRL